MNERIRELAEQAGATVDKGTHPLTGVVDGLIMRTTEIEKFAELIVRECAQIGEDVDGNQTTKNEILKHFGVEE